jgi:pimeloyl-ACP methyl ester carboxylesterase
MRKILTLLLLSFVTYISNAQADLICLRVTTAQTTIARGDYFFLNFKVKNQGTTSAGLSHAYIFLTDSITGTSDYLSLVSVEAIAAGDSSSNYDFVYPIPYNVNVGRKYIKVIVNSLQEVNETNTLNNTKYSQKTFNIPNYYGGQQNLPYPVILMHGLNGNDTTWFPFLADVQSYYGYSYGGNFDFCLNQDGDSSYSYLTTDVKNWTDTNQLVAADFYTINFDMNNIGNKYAASSKSNQSAIVKQGLAMQQAIKKVLSLTGKDKVILAGHSMGGLTCREYLQNTYRWQPDGKHHIAKLLTNGTPHGGSNSTSFGLGAGGIDEKSEAVRDLRRTYFFGGNGVYLYGGIESYSNIKNNILINYHNVDVNCDGIDNSGLYITGINYKTFPSDLSYSCIIGEDPSTLLCGVTSEACDGVVNLTSANLNNYLSVYADTFNCKKSGSSLSSPLHIELPRQTDFMMKGLDESNEYNTSYSINTDKIYFANFSVQSKAGYSYDFDDYILSSPCDGNMNFKLYNIPLSQCYYRILDTSYNTIYKDSTKGKNYVEFNKILKKGKYYIEVYCKPDETAWYFPYAFKIIVQPVLPIAGRIITPKVTPIKNVFTKMYKDSIATQLSDATGKYSFTLSKIGNYTLRPTKNNDITKANGINATDVLFTQRHILNTTKLNSAYKLIAADVNGDKVVNATDVLRIKRLILGTDTTFTKGTGVNKVDRLWEFVNSAYVFPDTTNPFPFKDSISFTNLTSNKINQTFIGVKLGDVNYDWNPAVAKQSTVNSIQLIANFESKVVNGELRIPITVKNFKDIVAMQYTLHFNNKDYEFVGIENNKLEIDFNSKQANQNGNISFLWTDKNAVERSLEDGADLFVLVLRSTVDRRPLTDLQLTINNSITDIAAWDKDYKPHNIFLSKRETPQTTNIEQWTIYPNPTKGLVNLYVETLIGKGSIVITDLYGKTVKTQNLSMGTNTVNIANLSKGMYFVSTITNEGKTTKKLVVE